MKKSSLSPILKKLIRQTMSVLGECYQKSFGQELHRKLMKIRTQMTELRGMSMENQIRELERLYAQLLQLSPQERMELAKGFALMMEVTNLCENAYRAFRWREKSLDVELDENRSLIFVLTAHPTESRSSESVLVMQRLQHELTQCLSKGWDCHQDQIRSLMSLIVDMELAPTAKPEPQDEARYICETVLRYDWLDVILESETIVHSFKLRTWVGGDKDGHPGVDEKVMRASLEASRTKILEYLDHQLQLWQDLVKIIDPKAVRKIQFLKKQIGSLRHIRSGDSTRVRKFHRSFVDYFRRVRPEDSHAPYSKKILRIFEMFPALVIPLELRESSDVLHECQKSKKRGSFAIFRMLKSLHGIAPGVQVRDYARSFIISMTHQSDDLKVAQKLISKVFGFPVLPIVPLFETKEDLEGAPQIIRNFLKGNKAYLSCLNKSWHCRFEVMLGYSDSTKQSGVLRGRTSIRTAMKEIEAELGRMKLAPLFFHGSGGSVARGGGNLEEQTQGWSSAALNHYKATIQGEIVSRTFAEPEIFLSQIKKISDVQARRQKLPRNVTPSIEEWAKLSAQEYEQKVSDPEFLGLVRRSTLYPFLHELKIGSRPSKRKSLGGIQDLRAIPWVLCWTQVRVLFPNWWGLARSWNQLSKEHRQAIQKEWARENPFLLAFMKQLGFSLAKVNLPVWWMYLKFLGEDQDQWKLWQKEFQDTIKMYKQITKQKDLMWFRSWLGESIYIRTPLIHPLNLLQIIALKKRDMSLLRVTVTGIASGMLTTG